jgi:hypothetical protein
VDGEIGRFTFKTHHIVNEGHIVFDTSKDFFYTFKSKEWYRTEGFNEIAMDFVTDLSYRKATLKFNRIRWQEEHGTPSRTLAHIVEIEGTKVHNLKKKCQYELSLTLKGSKYSNSVLSEILPLLWVGKVDKVIAVLKVLSPEKIKLGQSTDRLIGYFERNREYIPCYALRKSLDFVYPVIKVKKPMTLL